MARPRKTGLDYFPHDVDVTTDPKIEPAIMRYGAAAYAFYFVHLEYCYRSDDLTVDISATETGAEMREVIQRKLHIDEQQYDNILQSFLRHGAFDADFYAKTGKLTSHGIQKRARKVFEKREREAERYESKISAPISATETGAEMTQSIAKKSIENKSTEKKSEEYSNHPLTPAGGSAAPVINIQEKRFEEFWAAYPKKTGKQAAFKSWQRVKPTAELHAKIIKAVATAKRTEQWQRENGRFIPNPATWLNQGRWDDEYEEVTQPYGSNSQHSRFKLAWEEDDNDTVINKQHTGPNKAGGFALSGFHRAEDAEWYKDEDTDEPKKQDGGALAGFKQSDDSG